MFKCWSNLNEESDKRGDNAEILGSRERLNPLLIHFTSCVYRENPLEWTESHPSIHHLRLPNTKIKTNLPSPQIKKEMKNWRL